MLKAAHLELILYKAYADLHAETAKTYIGFLWWIIDPIIFMFIFYVIFGLLLERRTEDFISFLLVGLVPWRWFQNTVMHGANTIIQSKGLMRQIYLPKIIFPLVNILTDFYKFFLVFTLLLIYLWLRDYPISLTYLALPLILAIQLLLIVAVTFFVAAVVPFAPDLKILIEHFLHLMFFVSGIFFAGSSIPEKYQTYFYLNPMACLIDAYRSILLDNQLPDWLSLLLIGILSLLCAYGSYRLLFRYDRIYPKVVA